MHRRTWETIYVKLQNSKVTSPFPPSNKIGIKSVQMKGEKIILIKEMKMNWVSYILLQNRLSLVEHLKSQIFTLQCTQQRAALKQLKHEQIKKNEYCLPSKDVFKF